MLETVTRLFEQLTALAQRAYEAGWISAAAVRDLHHIEHRSPADLFEDHIERPLVVALFGGTGVGKSSLLNRLAGAQIARTGAERPTSREVTVFVHEGVKLRTLPPELPLRQVGVSHHANGEQRDVMWIDCPDIDSTVTDNRELALAWLAHADLVVYVVSPERYRDDAGWRVLRNRGERHGWVFVMNRSDEGHPEQSVDFARLLGEAGFSDPQVLRTSCKKPGTGSDEFDRLIELIRQLIREHGVRELERRGLRAKLVELREAARSTFHPLGGEADWPALAAMWDRRWTAARESLVNAAKLAIRGVSQQIVQDASSPGEPWRQWLPHPARPAARSAALPEDSPLNVERLRASIWAGWAQSRFLAMLEALEVDAIQCNLASIPLRRRLDEILALADEVVGEPLARAAADSLSQQPSDIRAWLRRAARALCYLLPAAVICWTGYLLISRFHLATTTTQPVAFFGMDFVVHSVLLVSLAWGAPFAVYVALRPNQRERVEQALGRAYRAALDRLAHAVRGVILETAESAAQLRSELERLITQMDRCIQTPPRSDGVLKTVTMSQPPGRSDGPAVEHGAPRRT